MKRNVRHQLQYLFFVVLAVLALYTVFHDNDLGMIWSSLREMRPGYLLLAAADGLLFTMIEGVIIWYLLKGLQGHAHFGDCIRYSFVGFLYSGITPSASGGQPMQLYHLSRDGNSLSASTVVLMTVALVYKLVLVLMGIAMLLFGFDVLTFNLGRYLHLFYLGMFLNTALVVMLLLVMFFPNIVRALANGVERLLVRIHIYRNSTARRDRIEQFIVSYQQAVEFLVRHTPQVALMVLLTFVQRCMVFLLPYLVYRGFGLAGSSPMTILMVQMAIYLAVDMLPLPGAQGITELMYRRAFRDIFTAKYVIPSMCVTRGVSFYFILFFSFSVCALHHVRWKRRR